MVGFHIYIITLMMGTNTENREAGAYMCRDSGLSCIISSSSSIIIVSNFDHHKEEERPFFYGDIDRAVIDAALGQEEPSQSLGREGSRDARLNTLHTLFVQY